MKSVLRYLRWLYRHSKGVRAALVLNLLLGTVNVALNLAFIFLCKRLVDIATGLVPGDLALTSCMAGGVLLLRLGVTAYNTWLETITNSKMNFLIRSRLYAEVIQARWAGRERMHTGDMMNRLETDVTTVTGVICTELPQMVTTLIQLVSAVVFLALMDWRLTLLLVLLTPVFLLISKVFFRRMRQLTRRIRETESRVQSHIQESLRNRTLVKSLEQEPAMEDRLGDLQSLELGQVQERTRFNILSRTLISASFSGGYIAAFLWGVYGISLGTSSFGMMTAFLQLVGQIQRPAVGLTRQIPALIYATASIDRLMELEDAPKEEQGEPLLLSNGPCGVRVEGVTFRYPDGKRDVLRGLSMDFKPGSRTAIVGETGVGKSTLIRLMLSLLHPVSGRIVLYDASQEEPASPRTRRNLVYVPQGNSLFSGTVRENLLMGDPAAGEEQMRKALETAVADFVYGLADGLDTLCGEGGAGLSEGQAQRIAIARALLRPGSILLLDEFSSSLDPETEEKLLKNLTTSPATQGKTMIFITHREKIADYCDAVTRLDRPSSKELA